MTTWKTKTAVLLTSFVAASSVLAQEPNPTQQVGSVEPAQGASPLYRVDVVAHTTKAMNYGHRAAPTEIDFRGTVLQPQAKGEARMQAKNGVVSVRAKLKNLDPPWHVGSGFLTYVLWAVTPDGRATNLGEIVTDSGDDAKLETATELQTFALIVTAEPYYAVTQPSDAVVMENVVRPSTAARIQVVDAKYELLKRGEYTYDVDAAKRASNAKPRKVSQREYEALAGLHQARTAIRYAENAGAAGAAPDALERARNQYKLAQRKYEANPKSREVVTLSREAAQTAEDARIIALRQRTRQQDSASEQGVTTSASARYSGRVPE